MLACPPSTNALAVSNPELMIVLDDRAPAMGEWMKVSLTNVHLNVRCGLHPWERHPERPNRLLVSIDMYAPAPPDGFSGARNPIIDYDAVRNGLLLWEGRDHVDFLEALIEDAMALGFSDPQVQACRVAIRKPDIFNETEEAGVEVFRRRPGTAA